jgi:hypothetical protein
MSETKNIIQNEQTKALVPMGAHGLEPTNIDEMWRYGDALSRSAIVPQDMYFGKPENCFIALDLASRCGCHWLTIMQHVYVVYGRPAMDSALCTALVNKSGLFNDPLEYEVEGGDDALGKDYRVRAYAVRKSTGKTLYGPWVDWRTVKSEGWDSKAGSKWKSIPDLMFHYRAASWFQRRYCPEVTLGMLTVDEATDMQTTRRVVESTEVAEPKTGVEGVKEKLAKKDKDTAKKKTAKKKTSKKKADAENTEAEKPPEEPTETTSVWRCTECDNRVNDLPANSNKHGELQCDKCLKFTMAAEPAE